MTESNREFLGKNEHETRSSHQIKDTNHKMIHRLFITMKTNSKRVDMAARKMDGKENKSIFLPSSDFDAEKSDRHHSNADNVR
jgi:hypothetical protein